MNKEKKAAPLHLFLLLLVLQAHGYGLTATNALSLRKEWLVAIEDVLKVPLLPTKQFAVKPFQPAARAGTTDVIWIPPSPAVRNKLERLQSLVRGNQLENFIKQGLKECPKEAVMQAFEDRTSCLNVYNPQMTVDSWEVKCLQVVVACVLKRELPFPFPSPPPPY